MDVNEPVVEETTEKNPYGIEPESYAELEENHPKLYKNTSSGQSPGNPFEGGGDSGGGETQVIYTITPGEAPTITCNKTFAEIRNIIADGVVPMFCTRTVLVDARGTGTLFVGYELSQNLLKPTFI